MTLIEMVAMEVEDWLRRHPDWQNLVIDDDERIGYVDRAYGELFPNGRISELSGEYPEIWRLTVGAVTQADGLTLLDVAREVMRRQTEGPILDWMNGFDQVSSGEEVA